MRSVMTALGVMAIVVLGASAVFANPPQQILVADDGSDPNGWGHSASPGWYSSTATTGGALWIDTGSGPVQYNIDTDVNVQLLVDAPAPYGWTAVATYLLSDGSANGDETDFYPDPGLFLCTSAPDPSIPGTDFLTGPYASYNMELYVWTGNYNTYTAAVASRTLGVYVADSGVFNQSVPFGSPPPFPDTLVDMPATILQQVAVPEPSTLALAAAGLVVLLAYAWRKPRQHPWTAL